MCKRLETVILHYNKFLSVYIFIPVGSNGGNYEHGVVQNKLH